MPPAFFKNSLFFLVILIASLSACVPEKASLKTERSLPAENLARYNDSFDSLREDLWRKAGYIRRAFQGTNFKIADVSIEVGRVKVETKPGSFSTGGLSSNFYFKRNFDLQVDCSVDFPDGSSNTDQVIVVSVLDRNNELEDDKIDSADIIIKKIGDNPASILCGYSQRGKWKQLYASRIGDKFQGTLRIVSISQQISLLFKTADKMEWTEACTFPHPGKDMQVSFKIRNYGDRVTGIEPQNPFTVYFDNFQVTAAQEIIEEEI